MVPNEVLQGWNAIAEFLNCDVRTAKRWETERGLPVRRTRRTPGEGRANVSAVISELEAWRVTAKSASESQPDAVRAETDEVPVEVAAGAARDSSKRWWVVAGAIVAVCVAAKLSQI